MKKKEKDFKKWEVGLGMLENDVLTQQQTGGGFVERRRAPRVSMAVPVHFRVKEKVADWRDGESVDISKYGIRISSVSSAVTPGMKIDLSVKLPGTDEPIDLEGVIVWVKPSSKGGEAVECGISFENPARITRLDRILGFLADKLCQFAARRSEHLRAFPVQSKEELLEAYRLVYDQYALRGYCDPNDAKMYYTYFCLLPESRTFLLRGKEKLLGTISLIPDSPCGLPMESVFPKEVSFIRRPQRRLAEISLLSLDLQAFEKKSFSLTDFEKLSASFKLFKTMFHFAHQILGVTDLLISMHPKHQGLYQYLKFNTISDVRSYWFACNKPAVAMHLNVLSVVTNTPKNKGVGAFFLKNPVPAETLRHYYQPDGELVRKFLFDYREIWNFIPPQHRRVLQEYYPELSD